MESKKTREGEGEGRGEAGVFILIRGRALESRGGSGGPWAPFARSTTSGTYTAYTVKRYIFWVELFSR